LLNNTILPKDEVEKILGKPGTRQICWQDLQTLAFQLTELYIKLGYVTSVVIVPEQEIKGEVVLQVYEGKLDALSISGLKRVQESYVQSRFSSLVDKTLNIFEIEKVLQQLSVNPLFADVRGELKPGSNPQTTILEITIVESDSVAIQLGVDNYQSPLVGEVQGQVGFDLLNLSGFGDSLSVSFQLSEGADKIYASYFLPLNSLSGGLRIFYEGANSQIILPGLESAGIRWDSNSYGLAWIQPLILNTREEFSLGISLEIRDSRSFILDDEPFSFSDAAVNGVTKFRVIRVLQDWVKKNQREYFVLRTRLNFGLDGFDATLSENYQSTSLYWFGQFQYGRQVHDKLVLVGRFGFQLSISPLPPIEQFEIGGPLTVRGYPRPTELGDNGIYLSTELLVNLVQSEKFGNLELVPFADFGQVWNSGGTQPTQEALASLGMGLRYYFQDILVIRLDYGIPLVDVEEVGSGLSSQGFNFSVYLVPLKF
jgi:hemolysin activation/secretion protein